MTKHVCGTCRFFKAAGFDNMGWCTNPKRREGPESLLFHRSLELPCRNDWASDLWQSAEHAPESNQPIVPTIAPEPPIVLEGIRFSSRANDESTSSYETAAARGEDIVVGERTSMTHRSEEPGQQHDPKGSVRRAHEELRLRNRERRPGLQPESAFGEFTPPTDAVIAESASPATDIARTPRSAPVERAVPGLPIGDVPPVTLEELGRPFPKITTYPADADIYGTIPEPVAGFDLPLLPQKKPARLVGRAGFDDGHGLPSWSAGEDGEPLPPIEPPDRRPQAWRAAGEIGSAFEPPSVSIERSAVFPAVEDDPAPPAPKERRSFARIEPTSRDGNARFESTALTPETEAPLEELSRHDIPRGAGRAERQLDRRIAAAAMDEIFNPDRERTPVDEVDELAIEPAPTRRSVRQRSESVRDDVDDFVVRPEPLHELIDVEPIELWADMPRMCRTCRDFRPAESGDRGWCNNKWAFSHRRMVDADELPCETSIGDWWLANDELWSAGSDVSAHGQPTPLLDQWLGARAAARGEYDVASSERRRQHS